jgi:hypothetical protein
MRYLFLIVVVFISACGGSLSEDQRKRMREQMELQEIKKVSDAEITEAAYARGRQIMNELSTTDAVKKDSIINASQGKIRWIVPGSSDAIDIEQQLIDAYIAAEAGDLQDNIQEIRTTAGKSDSILYTKPVVIKLTDGTERLDGVWNIWLSKKQLILSMDKK